MRYQKHQFIERHTPDFTVLDGDCSFCFRKIKGGEMYFETTEGWGVDIIQICTKCFNDEIK